MKENSIYVPFYLEQLLSCSTFYKNIHTKNIYIYYLNYVRGIFCFICENKRIKTKTKFLFSLFPLFVSLNISSSSGTNDYSKSRKEKKNVFKFCYLSR